MNRDRLEDAAECERSHENDDRAVDVFAVDMKRKLAVNVHKKHWSDVPRSYLFLRLLEEEAELYDALNRDTPQEIIDECADVANFAMMLADCARNGK